MRLIALCGAPGVGKTAVQEYLQQHFNVTPVDDGAPIREIAMAQFGLSKWHVTTQEGKASNVTLPGGNVMPVRVLLGEIGNKIEAIGGPDCIPAMALKRVRVKAMTSPSRDPAFCFGSVRRQQGHLYKQAGGKVIEIVRPGHECVNEFDQYDKSCVDLTINNNSSLQAFMARVEFHIGPWLRSGLTF